MNIGSWWEANPGRLEYELEALRRANIEWSQDKDAFAAGVLRLNLGVPALGPGVELWAVFPDLYPYFRFEVYAFGLELRRHQNPVNKNLCLIGRSTERWRGKEDTLASYLVERLPQVIHTGTCGEPAEVEGLEEHQAEPISDYFPRWPKTSVIVDGRWSMDERNRSGSLLLGVASPSAKFLNGAVLEVLDEDGRTICRADDSLRRAFSSGSMIARWVKLSDAPKLDSRKQLIEEMFRNLQELDPHPNRIEGYPVDGGRLQIRAAVFPEETNNWRELDHGWLFACRLELPESWERNRGNSRRPRNLKGRK